MPRLVGARKAGPVVSMAAAESPAANTAVVAVASTALAARGAEEARVYRIRPKEGPASRRM